MTRILLAIAAALTMMPQALAQAPAPLKVSGAWLRAAAPNQVTGGYAVFENPAGSPVAITAVKTAAARTVELHVMTERDSVMKMQRVDRFVVPAGGRFALSPGGAHLMLFGVSKALVTGDQVTLTIVLDDGREFDVRFEVRARDA